MLNIFRLHDNPLEYQVTYNSGTDSWVRVFDPEGVVDFLVHDLAFAREQADRLRDQLGDSGHAVVEIPSLSEAHLVEEHFARMPSDD